MQFSRHAVYVTLPDGPLQAFAAAWLGWDAARGRQTRPPELPGLPAPAHDLTARPRRYGLHGTMKPPFRLAADQDSEGLRDAFQALCANAAPVVLEGLKLSRIGRFLALTPTGPTGALEDLAARCVDSLDRFRAPPSEGELNRRRHPGLSPRQRDLLDLWGYPYVMEEFRFHITLTGPLPDAQAQQVEAALRPKLEPLLPSPFRIDALTLCGEDENGMFHERYRYALAG